MFQIDTEGLYLNRIRLTRGDSCAIKFSLIGQDGEPVEILPDDKVVMTVKESTTKKKAVLSVPLGEDGQFTIKPADTEDLDYGSYVYDVQVTWAGGDVITTVLGPCKFEIKEEVTW